MNPRSYLPMRILALVCTFFTVSAFVNLQSTSGGRICRLASTAEESNIPEKLMEEVWRYVKKPLISVGGKGATSKHGNSLRQLLDDHTVVKVKVNTKSFGTSRILSEIKIEGDRERSRAETKYDASSLMFYTRSCFNGIINEALSISHNYLQNTIAIR